MNKFILFLILCTFVFAADQDASVLLGRVRKILLFEDMFKIKLKTKNNLKYL